MADALVPLWEASDRRCSKRLVGVLPDLVAALERHGELQVEPPARAAVVQRSPAALGRRLSAAPPHVGELLAASAETDRKGASGCEGPKT